MTAPRLSIAVDRAACMGSGRCVADSPDLMNLDDDNRAVVVGDSSQLSVEDASDLAFGCPGGAISVIVDGVELEL